MIEGFYVFTVQLYSTELFNLIGEQILNLKFNIKTPINFSIQDISSLIKYPSNYEHLE